jgi:type II secretory pathway component GspD/PulD (secretin)
MCTVLFLVGCANNPELREKPKLAMNDVENYAEKKAEEFNRVWSERDPAITFLQRESEIFVERIYALPKEVADRKMRGVDMRPGSNLGDLSGILYPYKLNVMFESGGEDELSALPFNIKRFKGSIAEFLSLIEGLHNISFEYIGSNTLKVSRSTRYIASLPQVEQVLDSVKENIEALGGVNAKTNQLAGSIIYNATNKEQRDIESFINRFYENYAGVKMQITVFNVSLRETLADGFDWSSLDVVLGSVEAAYAGGYVRQLLSALDGQDSQNSQTTTGNNNTGNNNTGNNNTGSDNSSNTNSDLNPEPDFDYRSRYDGSSIDDIRAFGWLKEDSFEVGAYNNNVSVSVALDWMNQYGNTEATQSAFIETITGKQTIISSQRKVPVITEESTTFVGTQNPSAVQNTNTDSDEVGIKVDFTPYYDASSQEMIINLVVNLKSLVGNKTLTSATGQKFERPEIQEENFPTTVRMKVGETKLLGGIIFETIIESRSDVNIIDMNDDYVSRNMSKSAMFVMIRPSIHLFSQVGDEL